MRSPRAVMSFLLFLMSLALAKGMLGHSKDSGAPTSPLDAKITRFDVTDAVLRDGVSELSLKNVSGLHLGFEEIVRERIQDDPRTLSPHFSLHLAERSVREILGALCKADARYAWAEDGASVNIFPVATKNDPSYLLNLRTAHITVDQIPDPDQGLTPLSRLFPNQQVGYFGSGLGDNTYATPWTMAFEDLTVRQFINRLAEHMGPKTSWVWEGGKDERMFTFLKGGFNTSRP